VGLVSKVQERKKFYKPKGSDKDRHEQEPQKYISWFKSNGSLVIQITTPKHASHLRSQQRK
jgi:hypothetical protein